MIWKFAVFIEVGYIVQYLACSNTSLVSSIRNALPLIIAKLNEKIPVFFDENVYCHFNGRVLLACRFYLAIKFQRRRFGHKANVPHTHIGIHSVHAAFIVKNNIYIVMVYKP